jgi:hypothetical protein
LGGGHVWGDGALKVEEIVDLSMTAGEKLALLSNIEYRIVFHYRKNRSS